MQRYEAHTIAEQETPFIFANTSHTREGHSSCICNWHENVEILFITKGEGTFRLEDNEYPVKAGDICVVNMNQIHDIYSNEKDWMRYSFLIIDRTFFLQNGLDSNNLRFQPLIRDEKILQLLNEFEKEYLSDEGTPYRTQQLRCIVLQIILKFCKEYSATTPLPKSDKRIHSSIKRIIGIIQKESHTDISLDKIARAEGWNKCYLAREFRRYTGQSMISFLHAVRCEKAKTLLKESTMNIGEIGRTCGFNDQTYFTRTFRGHTGKTPGEYRKARAAKHQKDIK